MHPPLVLEVSNDAPNSCLKLECNLLRFILEILHSCAIVMHTVGYFSMSSGGCSSALLRTAVLERGCELLQSSGNMRSSSREIA